MKQYSWIIKTASLVIMFCLPFLAMAQLPPDPGPCPTCIPIDGGLSLLIAAGVGYGIKKVRDSRKQKQLQQEVIK